MKTPTLRLAAMAGLLFACAPQRGPATLTVGADKQFRTVSSAVVASRNGDVVAIDAGTYANDFATISKAITLRGVGGMAHIAATVAPPNGKAILTTQADVVLDRIELSGAAFDNGIAGASNAAGIRHEAGDLTLLNSYIHDNEMGLLAAPSPGTNIAIRNTEFGATRQSDGTLNHALYVNNVQSLTIENSYFHEAADGHEIKSRARSTTITGSRIQDEDGGAAYTIDLPNGGRAHLANNVIQQGPNTQNPAVVSFGAEGGIHPASSLTMTGNVVVNDYATSEARLLNNHTAITAELAGTAVWGLSGAQMVGRGPAHMSGTTVLPARPRLDGTSPWRTAPAPTLAGAR